MREEELIDDPCRAKDTFSGPRALVFVLMFVSMFGFSALAITIRSFPGMLLASVAGYTAAVTLYVFARNKSGIQPFLFTCPVVVSQYPRLYKRHSVFVGILIAILGIAHSFGPHASEAATSSRISDGSFFALAIPIGVLAVIEVMSNRGVLERAHEDRLREPVDSHEPERDPILSILNRNQ
jgi:hypothetical protein